MWINPQPIPFGGRKLWGETVESNQYFELLRQDQSKKLNRMFGALRRPVEPSKGGLEQYIIVDRASGKIVATAATEELIRADWNYLREKIQPMLSVMSAEDVQKFLSDKFAMLAQTVTLQAQAQKAASGDSASLLALALAAMPTANAAKIDATTKESLLSNIIEDFKTTAAASTTSTTGVSTSPATSTTTTNTSSTTTTLKTTSTLTDSSGSESVADDRPSTPQGSKRNRSSTRDIIRSFGAAPIASTSTTTSTTTMLPTSSSSTALTSITTTTSTSMSTGATEDTSSATTTNDDVVHGDETTGASDGDVGALEEMRQLLAKNFDLPPSEHLVSYFACMYWVGNAPVPSWLFITPNYIAFLPKLIKKRNKLLLAFAQVASIDKDAKLAIVIKTRDNTLYHFNAIRKTQVFLVLEQLWMSSMARGLDAAERQAALIEAQWKRDRHGGDKSLVAAVLSSKADSRIASSDAVYHDDDNDEEDATTLASLAQSRYQSQVVRVFRLPPEETLLRRFAVRLTMQHESAARSTHNSSPLLELGDADGWVVAPGATTAATTTTSTTTPSTSTTTTSTSTSTTTTSTTTESTTTNVDSDTPRTTLSSSAPPSTTAATTTAGSNISTTTTTTSTSTTSTTSASTPGAQVDITANMLRGDLYLSAHFMAFSTSDKQLTLCVPLTRVLGFTRVPQPLGAVWRVTTRAGDDVLLALRSESDIDALVSAWTACKRDLAPQIAALIAREAEASTQRVPVEQLVPIADRTQFSADFNVNDSAQAAKLHAYMREFGHGVVMARTARLREMVRSGLPIESRAFMWPLLCGAAYVREVHCGRYEQLLAQHKHEVSKSSEEIERDLHRSLPEHPKFQTDAGLAELRRVLLAYSWHNRGIL